MGIYSFAGRTSNVAIANATFEIRAGATGPRPRILEVGIFLAAATASAFGIGRPQAIGITPTSPQTILAEDPAEGSSLTQVAGAWGTGPTVPLNFLRRISLPATIGTGVIWTFPKGLVIPLSGSIVVWNITATGVADAYIVIDE